MEGYLISNKISPMGEERELLAPLPTSPTAATALPVTTGEQAPLTAAQRRRNLVALWIAEFTAILGFSLSFPFLPLFISQALGIQSLHEVAFWAAIVASVTEFSMAVCGPFWGILADRFGRKSMLVRAMVGGGVSVGLMGLSRSAVQLTLARALEGATAGTVSMASALVGSQTPRKEIARAMGLLYSAISLGGAAGPLVGGLIASVFGLRLTFLAGCVLLLLPTPIVMRFVTERRSQPATAPSRPDRRPRVALRGALSVLSRPLAVLLAAQFLEQGTFGAAEQLVALRMLELDANSAAIATGIAFGVAGVATALAGATYSRAINKFGYRRLATAAALIMACAIAGLSVAPSKTMVIIGFGFAGLVYGVAVPTVASMIGLGARPDTHGRIFGISAGAVGIGLGAGPLVGALVASVSGVQIALMGTAGAGLAMAAVLGLLGNEPDEA